MFRASRYRPFGEPLSRRLERPAGAVASEPVSLSRRWSIGASIVRWAIISASATGRRSHSRSREIAVLAATTLCLTMALPLALPGNTAAQNPSTSDESGAGVPYAAGESGVGELSGAGESGVGEPTVAQSDEGTDLSEGTERRSVERQSSDRVGGVVIALFSIAAAMSVMLAVFLWHTSPRRRLRLARARSQTNDRESVASGGDDAVSRPAGDA